MLVFGWRLPADHGTAAALPVPCALKCHRGCLGNSNDRLSGGRQAHHTLLGDAGPGFQGFLLAIIVAIPLGLVIGWFPVLDRMTLPVITFGRSVATLSLLPLAIVWFGTGELSKVLLIAYGCFWVMLWQRGGRRQIDKSRADPCGAHHGRRRPGNILAHHPASSPAAHSGRGSVSLGVGFMVIVGAEMIGTIQGLGALIMEARTFLSRRYQLCWNGGARSLASVSPSVSVGWSGIPAVASRFGGMSGDERVGALARIALGGVGTFAVLGLWEAAYAGAAPARWYSRPRAQR